MREATLGLATTLLICATILAQETPGNSAVSKASTAKSPPVKEELTAVPAKVTVTPVARDEEIRDRLERVLVATEWFTGPKVQVDEGVVFLTGKAETAELKKWAGDLARNTEDVVAVANRIEVTKPSPWDFSPAWQGVSSLWRETIGSAPFGVLGLIILAASVLLGMGATRLSRFLLQHRIQAKLLLAVTARTIGVIVFLVGAYVVLRVSGMTQLALSIIGGTGLVGLAVGIAFRDITENFLASIFLSMQRPFENGDLIEVAGVTGYVQQLNIRTTMVMTFDGNLVQIPNASVYKSNLRNFTTNANCRSEIVVGIGYDESLDFAQDLAKKVLDDHPAVLKDPKPMVLADSFAPTHVNLKIYYWINAREHSALKVKSSIIRLMKTSLQNRKLLQYPVGFPPPPKSDEPAPPPSQDLDGNLVKVRPTPEGPSGKLDLTEKQKKGPVVAKAEAGLDSEREMIEEQAKQAQTLKEGENLLKKPEEEKAREERHESKI